jgi:hypothetical protein
MVLKLLFDVGLCGGGLRDENQEFGHMRNSMKEIKCEMRILFDGKEE